MAAKKRNYISSPHAVQAQLTPRSSVVDKALRASENGAEARKAAEAADARQEEASRTLQPVKQAAPNQEPLEQEIPDIVQHYADKIGEPAWTWFINDDAGYVCIVFQSGKKMRFPLEDA